MLVIADRDRAQAVAGVMGGGMAEVSATTRTVAFESAYFKPSSVRRTSKRLGLKTEASSRFERGADINAPVVALQRIAALMERDRRRPPASRPSSTCTTDGARPIRLHLRRARLAALLGAHVPDRDVERILSRLGLTVTATADGWSVVAPTVRVDLLREVDLIEEVGRHYGFDKLPATFPVVTAPAPPPDPRVRPRPAGAARPDRRRSVGSGDVRHHRGEGRRRVRRRGRRAARSPWRIRCRPSSTRCVRRSCRVWSTRSRTTAVTGGTMSGCSRSGRGFRSAGETRAAAVAWTGSATPPHWSGAPRDVDFFDVKGVVEQLCRALGVATRCEPAREPFLVPGQTASLARRRRHDDRRARPGVAERRRRARTAAPGSGLRRGVEPGPAVGDRASPPARRLGRCRGIPSSSAICRSSSPDTLPAEIIRGTIQTAGGTTPAPLVGVTFFDRYQGKGIAEGSVSLSVRMTFQAPDRTLTDADVQASVDAILAALVREHGASSDDSVGRWGTVASMGHGVDAVHDDRMMRMIGSIWQKS